MQKVDLNYCARLLIVIMTVALTSCVETDNSEKDGLSHYRLTTVFLGPRQAMAVSTDADNSYVFEFDANGNDIRNQEWIITSEGDNYYRLTNRAFGESLSLDIVNDGAFNRVTLAPSANLSGQKWQITPLDDGYCRLTTEFLGPELALDVSSDTPTPMPVIRAIDEVSGQSWHLSQLGMGGLLDNLCRASTDS